MNHPYFWQLPLLIILFTSCQIAPRYTPPEMPVPCEWQSPPSEGMDSQSPTDFIWWETFDDPLLNALIQRASEQNLDLYLAAARVLEARLERKAKTASRYPHIDGSLAAGQFYYNKEGIIGEVLSSCPKERRHSVNTSFFEMGFDAEWEIDLFDAGSYERRALTAKIEAAEENLNDIWVTLAAEVARNYIELRGMQQRLEIAQANIESQKETVQLTQALLKRGMISTVDLQQIEEQLSALLAEVPLAQLSITKTIHRLSILMGEAPHCLFAELCPLQALPMLPCQKPIGIPSELLRRRPDIRKAERELAAATEQIGSAIAALFPRLSLRGFIGNINSHLSSLSTPSSAVWFISPQMLVPIFNSKMLQQDVTYNKVKAREAFYVYQKTVLKALEEAENAIAALHYEQERYAHLFQAKEAAQRSYQTMQQLYRRGMRSYLEVLAANRSLLAAENNLVQGQAELLLHYIALYKALGGGWESNCQDLPNGGL